MCCGVLKRRIRCWLRYDSRRNARRLDLDVLHLVVDEHGRCAIAHIGLLPHWLRMHASRCRRLLDLQAPLLQQLRHCQLALLRRRRTLRRGAGPAKHLVDGQRAQPFDLGTSSAVDVRREEQRREARLGLKMHSQCDDAGVWAL